MKNGKLLSVWQLCTKEMDMKQMGCCGHIWCNYLLAKYRNIFDATKDTIIYKK